MIYRLLAIAMLGVLLNGCYMAPLALMGPATSGFSTASLIQSGVTTTANYLVKKSSGKTIGEHALDAVNNISIQQSFFPDNEIDLLTLSKPKTFQIHKN